MKYWQFSTSATDANRFALRLARTGHKEAMIIAYTGCYHGTVDETVAILDENGKTVANGKPWSQCDPAMTTQNNRMERRPRIGSGAFRRRRGSRAGGAVMTNCGIVHPEPGYHDALRE